MGRLRRDAETHPSARVSSHAAETPFYAQTAWVLLATPPLLTGRTFMYIGVGAIVLILAIVFILMLLRGRSTI